MEETGLAGRVSDHIESDRIVDERPTVRCHVVVYRLPGDDKSVSDGPEEAHDVVVREPLDDEGYRQVRESWGFFPSSREAAEKAVELATENDCIVWDDIIVLRYPSDSEGE